MRDQRPFVTAVGVGDHDREFLQPEAIEEDLVLGGAVCANPVTNVRSVVSRNLVMAASISRG